MSCSSCPSIVMFWAWPSTTYIFRESSCWHLKQPLLLQYHRSEKWSADHFLWWTTFVCAYVLFFQLQWQMMLQHRLVANKGANHQMAPRSSLHIYILSPPFCQPTFSSCSSLSLKAICRKLDFNSTLSFWCKLVQNCPVCSESLQF